MLKEATNADKDDEMAKKIIDVTDSMNKKLDIVLERVVKLPKNKFIYTKMIFLSSIIYPTSDANTEEFKNELISDKEKRIEYIRYILSILKENK